MPAIGDINEIIEPVASCHMFSNKDFTAKGLAFHKSADELGDVLKTGSTKKSLNALHRTMNNCVSCHATFRQ